MRVDIGLLAFYLYLLVRKEGISRPLFYWIGVGALGLVILAGSLVLMSQHRVMIVMATILRLVGYLAALGAAVATCYKGKLPFNMGADVSQAPAAPVAPQAPAGDAGGNMDLSS